VTTQPPASWRRIPQQHAGSSSPSLSPPLRKGVEVWSRQPIALPLPSILRGRSAFVDGRLTEAACYGRNPAGLRSRSGCRLVGTYLANALIPLYEWPTIRSEVGKRYGVREDPSRCAQ
jgi:hypothetical protein